MDKIPGRVILLNVFISPSLIQWPYCLIKTPFFMMGIYEEGFCVSMRILDVKCGQFYLLIAAIYLFMDGYPDAPTLGYPFLSITGQTLEIFTHYHRFA
ncbi:MAG: hypothetical protein BWK74_03480 [Desulfobacteraceae bacterium A6]|nr:MAG: hypothetical protein BWK74_03480 [Desulfobacteraceae bacterium A6]